MKLIKSFFMLVGGAIGQELSEHDGFFVQGPDSAAFVASWRQVHHRPGYLWRKAGGRLRLVVSAYVA